MAQALAVIPGVSRSAATIISGMLQGIDRKTIIEFSFLLAVPTMLAATVYDLAKNFDSFTTGQISSLTVGFIVSFLVALASIKWLLKFIKSHTFISFGLYRLFAAVIFWYFIVR